MLRETFRELSGNVIIRGHKVAADWLRFSVKPSAACVHSVQQGLGKGKLLQK